MIINKWGFSLLDKFRMGKNKKEEKTNIMYLVKSILPSDTQNFTE